MAVVKVVMMQKDEGDALARWLAHYSDLFGFDNLTILDNGSTDKRTISLLDSAERMGTSVRRDLAGPRDFHRKGGHLTNIIRGWDGMYDYDFALPLDCDERLAVFTENGLSLGKDVIHAAFDALKGKQCAFRIETSLFNVPGREGWYAPVRHFHKGFVPAKTIAGCDDGQHEPRSRLSDDIVPSFFTYLHDHHHSYEEWRRRLKNKVAGLVDPDNKAALREYLTIPQAEGAHAVEALLVTKQQYAALYDKDIRIMPSCGSSDCVMIEGPGVDIRVWDAKSYLEANPDVRAYHVGTLQHYLRHGFLEGRSLALA